MSSIRIGLLAAATFLVCTATSVFAQGINLSWDQCGSAGTEIKSFACNTNTGTPFKLVGSFRPPAGINQFVGMSAEIRVAATSLPDWWKIGVGQCRTPATLTANFDFTADSSLSCQDPFGALGAGGVSYDLGYYGPNTARISLQYALAIEQAYAIDSGTEYQAFHVLISRALTTGAGSCAGCADPVRLTLNNIQVFQTPVSGNDPVLTNALTRSIAYWQSTTGTLPDIVSFAPGGGAEGSNVLISGTGLTATSVVRFGGVTSAPTLVNATQVQAPVPAGAVSGLIALDTPFGTATSDNPFTVAPVVTHFVPKQAPVASSVRIHGRNFTGVTGVAFNSIGATFTVISDAEIQAIVPASASTGPVLVTNAGGTGGGGIFTVGAATGGINLAWNDCGTAGDNLETFACNSNFGPAFDLIGSFVPPPGMNAFLAVTSDIRIAAGTLPEWWKHGTGQCRFTNGMSLSLDFSGNSACSDPWLNTGGGLLAHSIGFYGPETARLRVTAARGVGPVALSPDREYYAYRVQIARTKVSGLGMCTGCDVPVSLELQSIQLDNQTGADPVLTLPLSSLTAYWQGTPGPIPVIAGFSPPGGPAGTPVTVTGSNFTGTYSVRFGSVEASFTVNSDTNISTSVPVGAQSAPISVRNGNGVASTVALFYVNPQITDIVPPTAPVGTTVAIRGTGMAGTTSVTFNGTAALFTNISDAMITAVVPAGATTGPVVVTNPGGTSLGHLFTVGPLPTGTLDLAWDDCGAYGSDLKTFACNTNVGSGFPLVVSLRPPAGIVALTSMSARIRVDAGQLPDWWKHGPSDCRGLTGLSADLPSTTSCPNPWSPGSTPSLSYTIGFYGPETARLNLDVAPPPGTTIPLAAGTDQLGVRVVVQRNQVTGPSSCAHCSRPVRLNLEQVALTQTGLPFNPVLTVAGTRSTVYWQGTPQHAPEITASIPQAGAPGQSISIRGLHFTGVTSVSFRGTPATFTVPSDTAITATVPVGARTGPVTVETLHGVATSGFTFTVAPVITAMVPDQAPVLTQIYLMGFNFTGTGFVLFNGTPATFTVVNDSLIQTTVPLGATTGSIAVGNGGGIGYSSTVFTIGPLSSGIDLSWTECGMNGVEMMSFACNTNSGAAFSLFGSFRPPSGITELVGMQALVQITSSGNTLPDWWKHGAGQCRGVTSLSTTFTFTNGACTDPFLGVPTGGQTYQVGFYGPNTARLQLQCAVPSTSAIPLNPSLEYYAFRTSISRFSTTGSGSCSGCAVPVRLDLQSVQLIQNAGVGINPVLATPLHRTIAYWQGIPGPSPIVTYTHPTLGPPGTPVLIEGYYFTGATSVLFHNAPAVFTIQSDSVITTQVPSNGRTGRVYVSNANGIGQSLFPFYVDAAIVTLLPPTGPVGRDVRVVGYNFTGATQLNFNGVPAPFVVVSDTLITTEVPAGATTGPIRVTTPAGTAESPAAFVVQEGPPEGINLAWVDCGSNGTPIQQFACNVNTGASFRLIGSFQAPDSITQFLGMSADMLLKSGTPTLPDWWKHGSGYCRGTTGLATSFDFTSGPFACIDPYYGQAAGGFLYEVGFGGPSQARLRIQAAVPFDNAEALVAGEEYYAFTVHILRSRTIGSGSCSGCDEEMEIELLSIQLFQPPALSNDPILTSPLISKVAYWQGTPAFPSFTFSPPGGSPGAQVTLQGSGFTGATLVEFGNLSATYLVVSDQIITATVPAGARTAQIRVTTPLGTLVSSTMFFVTPVITQISPAQAPTGAQVGIVGYNFTGTSAVFFNGLPASFSIPNDGLILATVPDSLPPGLATVVVRNLGGDGTAPFTVGPLLSADGINLSWDDCGTYGTTTKSFACDVNSGATFPLVASYRPPPGVVTFLGLEAMLTVANPAGSLPDWWKHGTGACRGPSAMTSSFDFTANSNCADFFSGQAAGGMFYAIGGLLGNDPARAQILVQCAVPFESKGPLTPGVEYYAFRLSINRSGTTGPGACPGCETPMCIELNRIKLYQDTEANYDPVLELTADHSIVTWQNPPSCGSATPVQISLVISEAHLDHNRIVWEVPRGDAATVYRREGEGAWHRMDRLTPDGEQRIEYIDGDVRPGVTYRYRLGFMIGSEEIFGGETALTVPVPARTLALSRIGWSGHGVTAMVILPTDDPATLEVFDLSGRRAASRRLEGLGVGEKRVDVATRLKPGVYFGRLTQDRESVSGRFVVVQ